MICTNFYRFASRAYGTTFTARPDIFEKALKEGRNDFDLHCHKFLFHGDYEYYRFPIIFHQYDGKYLRDFLDLGYPPVYLVSNRVIELLRENTITGWKNYPISLFDKKGNVIEGYSGFSVIGEGGKFTQFWDYGYIPESNKSYVKCRGIYDISQWDGSDIFLVHNYIVITGRVMELMKSIKVTAVEYERLSDDTDIIGEPRFSLKL